MQVRILSAQDNKGKDMKEMILIIILIIMTFIIILNENKETKFSNLQTENLELLRENWRLQKECQCLHPGFNLTK